MRKLFRGANEKGKAESEKVCQGQTLQEAFAEMIGSKTLTMVMLKPVGN